MRWLVAAALSCILTGHARAEGVNVGPVTLGFEAGGGYAISIIRPDDPRFVQNGPWRLDWAVRAERPLCDRSWRVGGAIRLSTEFSASLTATVSQRFSSALLGRLELGTFTCERCRGVTDPRVVLRLDLESPGVEAFAETRVIAYDALQAARPVGTDMQLVLGLAAADWRATIVVVGLEALVVGYLFYELATHPAD